MLAKASLVSIPLQGLVASGRKSARIFDDLLIVLRFNPSPGISGFRTEMVNRLQAVQQACVSIPLQGLVASGPLRLPNTQPALVWVSIPLQGLVASGRGRSRGRARGPD